MWADFLTWLKDNQIGDLLGIAGIVISIFGFLATLIGVSRSKNAAKRAQEAAQATRESIRRFDAIVDFSATIAALEEIRRLQRQNAWSLLPDRYAAIRKMLIAFRQSIENLTDDQRADIQSTIATCRSVETQLDRAQGAPGPIVAARINGVMSEQIDNMLVILHQIKSMEGRGVQ